MVRKIGKSLPRIIDVEALAEDEAHEAQIANARTVGAVRRRLFLPVILPGILQNSSQLVVNPMLPIFVLEELHGSVTAVGLATSAFSMAQAMTAAPLGFLMGRVSYLLACTASMGVFILISLLTGTVASWQVLILARFAAGACSNASDLARKTCLSAEVPDSARGRVAATVVGGGKIANMLASVLGGAIAQHISTRSVFLLQAGMSALGLLSVIIGVSVMPQREDATKVARSSSPNERETDAEVEKLVHGKLKAKDGLAAGSPSPLGPRMVLQQNWRSFLGAGVYCAMISGCGKTFHVALPIRARQLGLNKQDVGFSVAIVWAMEAFFALCISGQLVDKYGLKAVANSGTLLMVVSFCLLPIVSTPFHLFLSNIVYSAAAGTVGGMNLNYSLSLAPSAGRAEFLGIWKSISALGGFVIPPLFGVLTDTLGFNTSSVVLGMVALFGVIWLSIFEHGKEDTAHRQEETSF